MSEYKAYRWDSIGHWEVRTDEDLSITFQLQEWQARVVEFALNGVAEGKVLCACSEPLERVRADFAHGVYDGPMP